MALQFGRHKVSAGRQAMVQRSDVPRSMFKNTALHKTTFDADYLIPIYCEEIVPGDSVNINMTAFVRSATPVFPIMDNLYVDTFWFFVPYRLVWLNWERFLGAQNDPDDSTDFLVPQVMMDGGAQLGTQYDYLGIPTANQVEEPFTISALPFRAINLIWNEWFRDQNLQGSLDVHKGDGPDDGEQYAYLRRRAKRHDRFTSALPWPQKGNPVTVPLTGQAPVKGIGVDYPGGDPGPYQIYETGSTVSRNIAYGAMVTDGDTSPAFQQFWIEMSGGSPDGYPMIYADLSEAASVTVNMLRSAVAVQQLLERNARGGTRYVELLRNIFGTDPQDYRLSRPEYLGGSSTAINFTPIAQTVEGDLPLGALGAAGTGTPRARISGAFPEHGVVIGFMNVRADITYQQGLHKFWSRRTRYDFPWPMFANLGEQVILNKELYLMGTEQDEEVFGYEERYNEYRYRQSMISGYFRSGWSGSLDSWHLAERFASTPTLDIDGGFIQQNTPMERVLAAGNLTLHQQFLADILFDQRFVRALPMYGTPGLSRF